MAQDSDQKVRRTSSEMYPLVEQWVSSGLSQKDFCHLFSVCLIFSSGGSRTFPAMLSLGTSHRYFLYTGVAVTPTPGSEMYSNLSLSTPSIESRNCSHKWKPNPDILEYFRWRPHTEKSPEHEQA